MRNVCILCETQFDVFSAHLLQLFHWAPCFTCPLLCRIEYDAYRTDLEELNLGPRDANTLPKIEQSQHLFQIHKEKYDKMRNDVSVKLKFLEENKVNIYLLRCFCRL